MDSLLRLKDQLTKFKYITYFSTLNHTEEFGIVPELRPLSLMIWNWRFFIATSVEARKAKEMLRESMVSFLVPLQRGELNGYLRVVGRASRVVDPRVCDEVGTATGYPLTKYWSEGGQDPTLFFAEIKPVRVEFMEPGEHEAREITAEFLEREPKMVTSL